MISSLFSETLPVEILIGILIGAVGMLTINMFAFGDVNKFATGMIKPMVRLLSRIPVVELGHSIKMFLNKPLVGLVMGVIFMCVGFFLVFVSVWFTLPLDITSTILLSVITFFLIASGTLITHWAWEDLKRNPGANQTGKNYLPHRID